jgi:endoglucanase
MGCYVALESARRIAESGGAPGDVIAVAAVQEEIGDFAGSRTAAFGIEPDLAVAIDVTHTSDVPGADPNDEGKILLGGGPTITRGPSIHPDVFELLHDTAEAEGIPFAIEASRGTTSTDADAVFLSRAGVATGLVSVPLRYMHSPIETLDLDDLENAVRLVTAFAQRLEPGLSFTG